MSTLLLRLAGPMQSWGTSSKFDRRLTEVFPSKSGVFGMLACALGIRREESEEALKELFPLRFGVRIDQDGELLNDYHIVHEMTDSKNPAVWVTNRYYLADAVFLVGLQGEETLLNKLVEALNNPVFPIFLGRRSCPPAGKLVLGLRNLDLQDALEQEQWTANDWYKKRTKKQHLEIFLDAGLEDDASFSLRDFPVSFDQKFRKYAIRDVVKKHIRIKEIETCETKHDPMELLEV